MASEPGTFSASRPGRQVRTAVGGFAPITVVQTSATVSPEQSFMGAAANGWDGWLLPAAFRHRCDEFRNSSHGQS
jgi:hypothetical protein